MKNPSSYKLTPFFYTCGHAFYWSAIAAIGGYTALYLSEKGISDSITGIIVSATAVISIILQLTLSDYLDKNPHILSKNPLIVLSAAAAVLAAAVIFIEGIPLLIVAFYTLALALTRSMSSFLNTVAVKSDVHIPFAIPRGIGAGTYAFTCLIIGFILKETSAAIVMKIYVPLCVLLMLSFVFMKEDHIELSAAESTKEQNKSSYFTMLKNNPVMFWYIIACLLNGIGQSGCYTFLIRIVEDCGGGSAELGIAMFIQAFSEVPMTLMMSRIIKRFRADKLLLFSFIAYAARIFMLAIVKDIVWIYAAVCLNMFCVGIFSVASAHFSNIIAADDEKARSQALVFLAGGGGLGLILGSALSGLLIGTIGVRGQFVVSGILCVLAAAAMLICCRLYSKKLKTVANI